MFLDPEFSVVTEPPKYIHNGRMSKFGSSYKKQFLGKKSCLLCTAN
jgi:hypothetical protein